MGLDMYLYEKRYFSNHGRLAEDMPEYYGKQREIAQKIMNVTGMRTYDPDDGSVVVMTEVAYWRKANAIHRWFVENVQGGTDDCGYYYVSDEQLRELRDRCQAILDKAERQTRNVRVTVSFGPNGPIEEDRDIEFIANADQIEELLPTQQGFFFGSTEYDSGYIWDLEATVQMLDQALNFDEGQTYADFEYHSSW